MDDVRLMFKDTQTDFVVEIRDVKTHVVDHYEGYGLLKLLVLDNITKKPYPMIFNLNNLRYYSIIPQEITKANNQQAGNVYPDVMIQGVNHE